MQPNEEVNKVGDGAEYSDFYQGEPEPMSLNPDVGSGGLLLQSSCPDSVGTRVTASQGKKHVLWGCCLCGLVVTHLEMFLAFHCREGAVAP